MDYLCFLQSIGQHFPLPVCCCKVPVDCVCINCWEMFKWKTKTVVRWAGLHVFFFGFVNLFLETSDLQGFLKQIYVRFTMHSPKKYKYSWSKVVDVNVLLMSEHNRKTILK